MGIKRGLNHLRELNLPVDDCKGQAYDIEQDLSSVRAVHVGSQFKCVS